MCRTCSSAWRAEDVTLGTLVDDPSIRPSAHTFVGSKAPWFAVDDDLPRHQGHAGAG
ncbi:hypothetical protein [Variovorax paradoxus]|uniref:hypothetical protein n=1 Tax=Variovorax paradoxus TaxID=34073 RepID=UPI003F590EBF